VLVERSRCTACLLRTSILSVSTIVDRNNNAMNKPIIMPYIYLGSSRAFLVTIKQFTEEIYILSCIFSMFCCDTSLELTISPNILCLSTLDNNTTIFSLSPEDV
jgi:hypothetical protein